MALARHNSRKSYFDFRQETLSGNRQRPTRNELNPLSLLWLRQLRRLQLVWRHQSCSDQRILSLPPHIHQFTSRLTGYTPPAPRRAAANVLLIIIKIITAARVWLKMPVQILRDRVASICYRSVAGCMPGAAFTLIRISFHVILWHYINRIFNIIRIWQYIV